MNRSRVAVVGGGPAGLIAAEVLAAEGCDVTVYEQSRSVGRKLLLAGRGGLNITHAEARSAFVDRYDAPEWIGSMLESFGVDDLRRWCDGLGEPTFVGSSGRVFPESFRATPLLRAWLRRLDELGVTIATQHRWSGWAEPGDDSAGSSDGSVLRFEPADGGVHMATPDATVLALGGASWPRTGSDGAWVPTLTRADVAVEPLRPANAGVAVEWSSSFVDRYAGEPLKNVAVRCGDDVSRGDPIVTVGGLEGGPIYALSRAIRRQLDHGPCVIEIDLHPDQSVDRLAERLARRRPKDSVTTWLRRTIGLSPVAVNLLREVTKNDLPDDGRSIAALAKRVPVEVVATMPIDRAISTAGGVDRGELDGSLMLRSRPGTFVAGEMIDWEAPTGGYLLQACFSTGAVAARGALDWLAAR